MRITFERSGGFAGLLISTTVESDSLAGEQAEELRRLVQDAGFFELPTKITGPAAQPDQFVYRITVETEDQRHTVRVENTPPPPPLQPLLDWLSRAARRGGRRP